MIAPLHQIIAWLAAVPRRPLLALLVAALMLGTVKLYMIVQASLPEHASGRQITRAAKGNFAIDVTLTFAARPDSFQFETPGPTVVVAFGAHELLRRTDSVPPGTPLVVENVPGVVEGRNEFFIEVFAGDVSFAAENPSDATGLATSTAALAHAVRVRVLRNGEPLPGAEQTLWSDPGEPVRGAIVVDVPRAADEEPIEHH